MNVKYIYKLTEYCFIPHRETYPKLHVWANAISFHSTKEDAEAVIWPGYETYCFILEKLPLEMKMKDGDNLHEWVYDRNGELCAERPFANTYCWDGFGPTTPEHVKFCEESVKFSGYREGELKFKPGDIVEILCYPGNHYFAPMSVELGIVAGYPDPAENEYGIRDAYKVMTLSLPQGIDHAPVTGVFAPHFEVRENLRKNLEAIYRKYGVKK